jgi:hypothetical protein
MLALHGVMLALLFSLFLVYSDYIAIILLPELGKYLAGLSRDWSEQLMLIILYIQGVDRKPIKI